MCTSTVPLGPEPATGYFDQQDSGNSLSVSAGIGICPKCLKFWLIVGLIVLVLISVSRR